MTGVATQPITRKIDAISRRKHIIRREAGLRLTDRQREMPGTAWNGYMNRYARISLRHFARVHNIPFATWQRELRRGAASRIVRQGNRWTSPEYDIDKAKSSINEGRSNMGAPMKLSVGMAILFRHAVLKLGRSPYDTRMMIVEAMPGKDVPRLKTFYNHIEAGDMGVFHGQTPYHPGRRRRPRQPAHEARTVPGRRQLKDRPRQADESKEPGHREMDTTTSRRGAHGWLPAMPDRCSRRYVIEHLCHINQDEVIAAIKKMKRKNAPRTVRSATADNRCEFLDLKKLDRAFKAETDYTRVYVSDEKGAIENCNRPVRRWHPEGTDFNQLARRQIRQLEDWINSIHRKSLD